MNVAFHIPITPVPKGRPRFQRIGSFTKIYTPTKTLQYEKQITLACKSAMAGRPPMTSGLHIDLRFHFEPPKSWSNKRTAAAIDTNHSSKPDIDNLTKAVMDALNGVAWTDDAQVHSMIVSKSWAATPCVFVHVMEA